ncbi:uncharacterized protein STEHIDRAFT_54151 [Stereum hirsutum FP-91666 SS1]|uniref:uncharacterized protein n=1 Tax=Stereum hirsutum (strain FP-91666) TaxID=721885 RepID=UPI000440BF2B|nr:uncharacterized protein STEHIDRAFT_54151 [Stereum hirsutum FP-91666 SS1]EIM88407.1 hypothetical protein STEHIDRAFT_54151 [Stereum hirsutum FP-91666 SS1]
MFNRGVDLVRTALNSPHSDASSAPSSPRSSTDSVLPLTDSRTSLSDTPDRLPLRLSSHAWWQGSPSVRTTYTPARFLHGSSPLSSQVHTPILFVLIMFPLSTAIVVFSLWSLPNSTISLPQTLSDLAQLGKELHAYSQSGPGSVAHIVAVVSVICIWMHAFSIPGAVLWNVLAGALFSPFWATLLLTFLTTIGSIFASLLATPLAPILTRFFPRPLALARSAFESDPQAEIGTRSKSPAWVRLSILRLVGVVPWSGINIACGVCGVSLTDILLGTFIGSLPWNAVTCQIGDILQTVASSPSHTPQTMSSILASPEIILKLVFLSFLSLAPILGRNHLKAWLTPAATVSDSDERVSRWTWVKEWRSKVRLPSRSRSPQPDTEKEAMMSEKYELEQGPSS